MSINVWKSFRAVIFVFLVFYSTYFGTIFLLSPIMPLFYMAPVFTRAITDKIIWFWKLYLVSILEIIIGTKVKVRGKVPSSEVATLIIMNHRTRFDWLYLFSYQIRHGSVRRYIISMKRILKSLPGVGWAGQIAGFIFLDRKWEVDETNISRCIKLFSHIGYKPQILLFPEGTDLSPYTKKRSDAYAEKYDLPKYDYVLHPKTTGFTHFVQEMKKGGILDCITDMTVGYDGTIPQDEFDLVKGNYPSEVHFLVYWIPIKALPSQKDDIENWCREKWQRKETVLKQFYEKKSFSEYGEYLSADTILIRSLFLLCWIFWTSWNVFITYILWSYTALWLYVFVCTVIYVCISKYTQGCNLLIAKAMGIY